MNEISVTFITDSNYLLPTWVAIRSLIESKSSNVRLNIYVIGDNLSIKEKETFSNVINGFDNIFIKYIDVDSNKDFELYKGDTDLKSWSPSVLYKLMICDILPLEVHKVIYLDGDMIIRQDLLQLFEIDISDLYLGAVRDTFYDVLANEERMNLTGQYINTGCILLNLDKMREDNLAVKLIKKKIECPELGLADQDTYNEVCRGKIKLLPLKYNFYITNFLLDENIEGFKKYTTCPYQSRKEMIEDIAIIHMIHYRPWKLAIEKKDFDKLVSDNTVSIWDSSIKYIVQYWSSVYNKSPFFQKDVSNIISKEGNVHLSTKGVISNCNIGLIKGKILQECKYGNIHISFWVGNIRLLEKVRIPGMSYRIHLF